MRKREKFIILIALATLVVLALVLAFTFGRSFGTPPDGSHSVAPPQSITVPQTESNPQSTPGTSTTVSGSIPYIGPIDSPIIGKWEKHPEWVTAYGMYYEFTTDGTLYVTQFYIEDIDYPDNWWMNTYNYYFDTWRGQEVLESGFFMGYMHHKVVFYELDGRKAMDIITIMDDGEEYVSLTLLKTEEA